MNQAKKGTFIIFAIDARIEREPSLAAKIMNVPFFAFTLLLLATTLACAEDAPILLLHFDEATNRVARDTSGRNNHGQITGAKLMPGKVGQALQFDGDDDFVDCGGERGERPDLDFGETTDFTVELWMRTTTTNRWAHLINKKCRGDEVEPGWMIVLDAGRVVAVIADGQHRIIIAHPTTVTDGQWHHIVLVAERKANAMLVVDGVAGTPVSTKELLDITNPYRTLRIGDRAHDGDFEGLIDEVRIDRAARKF
jgi:hypothetical protein